ncbi:hypothetical protein [Roseovarius halotolerans]|uniref:hypothetical protein n=1 Tax=Roseovarius halotolerans TaxID=505353 RepID=UPI000A26D5FF|nr:hypothetical protein [Roseovarius halotolerans]
MSEFDPARHRSFDYVSASNDWVPWVSASIPGSLDLQVRRRIESNLKHILAGLEMKAGLIIPHGERLAGREVLYEPYFQSLIFEFCVGVYSVCEGIGSAHHLHNIGDDGSAGPRVSRARWTDALVAEYDPADVLSLRERVEIVQDKRDRLHQDSLGARDDIDWHSFGYAQAFVPARQALQPLLQAEIGDVPATTNLLIR